MSKDLQTRETPALKVDEALLAEVREVVDQFTRTAKVFRTYPRENNISIAALDTLTRTFETFLNRRPELELFVKRHDLQWQGMPVYSETDPRKSLAMKLDRDGVRRLMFLKGITHDEVVAFIEVLTADVDEGSLDDDLVTLLWEKRLSHVKAFVFDDQASGDVGFDPALAGAGNIKAGDAPEYGTSMGARRHVPIGAAGKEGEQSASGPREDDPSKASAFDQTGALRAGAAAANAGPAAMCLATKAKLRPITAEEAAELEKNIRVDESAKASEELEEILLAIVRTDADPEICTNACKVLTELSMIHVRAAEFGPAGSLLRKMTAVAADDGVNRISRALAAEQLETLAQPARIVTVLDSLRKHENVDAEGLLNFLMMLPSSAACDLCELLEIERCRKVVGHAVKHLVKDRPEALAAHVAGKPAPAALNILRLLEDMANPAVVKALIGPLQTADDAVKVGYVKVLEKVKDAQSRALLFEFLASPNPSLRKAAAKALCSFGGGADLATPLRQDAASRDFDARALEEKMVLFEAIAKIESHLAVDFLAEILRRRGWFERQPHAETRACAALALGEIGSDGALQALRRSSSDRSQTVRSAVSAALSKRTALLEAAGK